MVENLNDDFIKNYLMSDEFVIDYVPKKTPLKKLLGICLLRTLQIMYLTNKRLLYVTKNLNLICGVKSEYMKEIPLDQVKSVSVGTYKTISRLGRILRIIGNILLLLAIIVAMYGFFSLLLNIQSLQPNNLLNNLFSLLQNTIVLIIFAIFLRIIGKFFKSNVNVIQVMASGELGAGNLVYQLKYAGSDELARFTSVVRSRISHQSQQPQNPSLQHVIPAQVTNMSNFPITSQITQVGQGIIRSNGDLIILLSSTIQAIIQQAIINELNVSSKSIIPQYISPGYNQIVISFGNIQGLTAGKTYSITLIVNANSAILNIIVYGTYTP